MSTRVPSTEYRRVDAGFWLWHWYSVHAYKRLEVWKRAHELALSVYRVTGSFPAQERYGLTSQMRRAALSIPTNLAEGSGRRSDADFARFVDYSIGSSAELEYQLLFARDRGYLEETTLSTLVEELAEVRRMLEGLTRWLLRGKQQPRDEV